LLVTPSAKPSVIPKEARLRDLLNTSLPLKQKRAQSFIVGDSSSFVVGMTGVWQSDGEERKGGMTEAEACPNAKR